MKNAPLFSKLTLMSNLIKIIGTGKHPGLPKGFVHYEVAEMADLIVKAGRATYEHDEIIEQEDIEKEKVQAGPESKKQIKKPTTKKTK